jgi:ornithine cyclodeaminase/alanine dehydrogenase-like protein (mu-crystallin family)
LLGELIVLKAAPSRAPKTVFKAVGVAHADLAVAEQLADRDRLGG